jgi:hypothetical protein
MESAPLERAEHAVRNQKDHMKFLDKPTRRAENNRPANLEGEERGPTLRADQETNGSWKEGARRVRSADFTSHFHMGVRMAIAKHGAPGE